MIRGFEPTHPLPPEHEGSFQWGAALGAGLIAGLILLIVPRGNPWGGLTFFAPVIMGRDVAPDQAMPPFDSGLAHLGISLIYGLIISLAVTRVTRLRAVPVGSAVSLLLYAVNLGVVSVWFPHLRGSEVSVAVTHLVFGAMAAGAYRGLLRRKPAA